MGKRFLKEASVPCARVTIAGKEIVACRDEVERIVETLSPEPIRIHWVLIGNRRFPPKQVVEAVARAKNVPLNRLDFQTMSARAFLKKLGFEMNS